MEIPRKPGIYCFTNLINGNKYVGASNNIKRRYGEHISPKKIKSKYILYKAFNKYGIDNFCFEVLEITENCNCLFEREIFWIDKLKPKYNQTKGGLGNLGMIVKEKTKQVLRIAGKYQWENKTETQKQALIKNNLTGPKKGHFVSEETRLKLRIANLGKKWTEEQRIKISSSQKKSMLGNKNGNKEISSVKDGKIVKTFNSAVEAGLELKIHPSSITGVLIGRRKTAAGFNWIYGKTIT
jgi:group I intron endonuclease